MIIIMSSMNEAWVDLCKICDEFMVMLPADGFLSIEPLTVDRTVGCLSIDNIFDHSSFQHSIAQGSGLPQTYLNSILDHRSNFKSFNSNSDRNLSTWLRPPQAVRSHLTSQVSPHPSGKTAQLPRLRSDFESDMAIFFFDDGNKKTSQPRQQQKNAIRVLHRIVIVSN